ncbi:DUF1194 domain-containing protein [Loktanella sp. SALINAS62]|uniref:DUF1194 domain-containing protein n=1 Tax=Loktanella sp. SALINAS62 TaxID=2706124 RepID=UPI001B8C7CA9|nr:DUF1194 domain-containing protein [Loktanella sp. SALINAS62]MBS1304033.1 DUF1194 domain-containing protein [Loktanella sp. SALINAS62]
MRWLATVLVVMLGLPADAACRQALAMGLDVSGSVDDTEYRLQRDGLADALGRDAVQRVLLDSGAPVRITVFEWSGQNDQAVLVPWTAITDALVLAALQQRIRYAPRGALSPTTALGSAMLTGFELLDKQTDCWTRTLDISGDGPSNTDPRPQDIGIDQSPADVTVNGLTIGADTTMGHDESAADIKELSAYFKTYVIRGPGAFVETALGFADYADAMERKLLRELRAVGLSATPATSTQSPS